MPALLGPASVVTTTGTAPSEWAGTVARSVVEDCTTTPVAGTPPTVTVAAGPKPVPVMVTWAPPTALTELGETVETVGGRGAPGAKSTDPQTSSYVALPL